MKFQSFLFPFCWIFTVYRLKDRQENRSGCSSIRSQSLRSSSCSQTPSFSQWLSVQVEYLCTDPTWSNTAQSCCETLETQTVRVFALQSIWTNACAGPIRACCKGGLMPVNTIHHQQHCENVSGYVKNLEKPWQTATQDWMQSTQSNKHQHPSSNHLNSYHFEISHLAKSCFVFELRHGTQDSHRISMPSNHWGATAIVFPLALCLEDLRVTWYTVLDESWMTVTHDSSRYHGSCI